MKQETTQTPQVLLSVDMTSNMPLGSLVTDHCLVASEVEEVVFVAQSQASHQD